VQDAASTSDGDVVLAGDGGSAPPEALVVRLDAASGIPEWQFSGGPGTTLAYSVAVGAGDAVYASGVIGDGLDVTKLDGTTGAVLWQQPDGIRAERVAAHPSGDVVVYAPTTVFGDDLVLRLSGTDGSVVWMATAAVFRLLVDASGDVLTNPFGFVTKLDGDTGAIQWSTPGGAFALALEPSGDVFAGDAFGGFRRLSGGTGAVVYDVTLAPPPFLHALAVGPSGHVAMAGALGSGFALGQLDAATGGVRWMNAFVGNGGLGEAVAIAVLPDDSVVGAGSVHDLITGGFSPTRFTAARASDRVTGRKLVSKDPVDPTLRKLTALSADGSILAGQPDAANDPRITGATLTLVDTSTLGSQAIPLPAGNWTVRPKDARTKYVYKDADLSEGPCKLVTLANGKKLKLKCLGSGLTFPMNAAAAGGTFGMRLEIGTSRACMVFGGSGIDKGNGVVVRIDAPVPAECP
jgi:hypothetical protein